MRWRHFWNSFGHGGLMRAGPQPLLNPDNGMMVVWSPKSACTTVFVWFAGTIGRLDEARASADVHRYRTDVYYSSDLYRRGLDHRLGDYRIVRVIRDPYARAASIYRHALRTRLVDRRFKAASAMLDRRKGFSFLQFLDYVGTLRPRAAGAHLRPQFHPIETALRPEIVINISRQDLFAELNGVEDAFGLPRTDFRDLEWLLRREARRKAKEGAFKGEAADDVLFDADAARGLKPWPDYGQLLTPRARARIETLYARDFEAYAAHL
jgi:hypothetical protein